MRRTIPGRILLLLLAPTAGCQVLGARPAEVPQDERTVARTISAAKFEIVSAAVQKTLKDHDVVRAVAGFDFSRPVHTTWYSRRAPFGKVATRALENGDRTITVKIVQESSGCVVTARVSTDTPGDPARSAALMDRLEESIGVEFWSQPGGPLAPGGAK
ncbi:MAG TPA: hypothetical protein VG406_00455 [Isosphaeraceae bacterium]|jgi:hypothetical protein|nr:hypothetical protein [Isosphaeraceae bacterium]